MFGSLLGHGQSQPSPAVDDLTRQWAAGIGLAVAVGSAYVLAGHCHTNDSADAQG
ncbi:hypothetical protein SAMN05444161_7135 [Rhizobiales bacterium GAS191]|nr:hypothetical protein SAMN05519103_06482 [Rhizobiales bacterium GAS113]SEE78264.1 hypothetical protein SAMN05444161_7135 [Rhizobiales bacterium GAS191]